jgi:NADPH2:quinone reductase
VQLAKWAGARVIATVSTDAKAERARAGGADAVVNYRQEDVAACVREITFGSGVDHVVDVDFGGNLAATLGCVRANGSIAIYASNGDRTPRVPIAELMQRNVSLYPMSLPGSLPASRKRAQTDIAQWIATGERLLSVAARFPLDQAAAAHEAVERGDKVGTVVIECAR